MEELPDNFSDYLVRMALDQEVIIKNEDGEVSIPDIDPLQLALERFRTITRELEGLDSEIENAVKILDKNISEYHKILETIPTDDGETKIPADLIMRYRKSLKEIKERDIERKLKSGEKLDTQDNMLLLEFKNAKATLNFLSKDTDFWKQINTIHDVYTRLISICKGNRQNLTYIGDKFGMFMKTAEGIRDILESISSLTSEERERMTDVTSLLDKVMNMAANLYSVIDFTSNTAFNLNKTANGIEIVGEFEDALHEVSEEVQNDVEVVGNEKLTNASKTLIELEEAFSAEEELMELHPT